MSEFIVQCVHSNSNISQKNGAQSLHMCARKLTRLSRLTVTLPELLYSNYTWSDIW